jgi:crossover junction endodeoxyribonuclease RuvC
MEPDEVLISVDPSLRGTGVSVLQRSAGKIRCLLEIHARVQSIIVQFSPHVMAIESVIYVQSFATAITLGSARGAALLAAAQKGLQIYEYAPRRVKKAVVGHGAAQKSQVAFMVRSMLGLTTTPPPDAADAIAVGLAHFQSTASPLKSRSLLK